MVIPAKSTRRTTTITITTIITTTSIGTMNGRATAADLALITTINTPAA